MNAVESLYKDILDRLPEFSDQINIPTLDYPEDSLKDEALFPSPQDWVEPLNNRENARLLGSRLNEYQAIGYGSLDDQERSLIEGGIRHLGFEVLAFYKSIRNKDDAPYPDKWGIFYLEPGIAYIEDAITNTYPGIGNVTKLAVDFLRQHERFHYMFDIYAMQMETAIGRHLYRPLKNAFKQCRTHQVEEALANRQTWQWAKKPSVGIQDFAYQFMKLQPNAYARFDEYKLRLKSELAANLIDHDVSTFAARDDQAPWVAELPAYLSRRQLCPEYVVQPASLSNFISPVVIIPPVNNILEEKRVEKLLAKKYQNLKKGWAATKSLLLKEPSLLSLNFKPWSQVGKGIWSVRVKSSSNNFRAHLRNLGHGEWLVVDFGPHKAMGHG